jgi:diguanylate cyclase (GGDEF)-like protein
LTRPHGRVLIAPQPPFPRGSSLELPDPSLLLLREDVGDCYEAVAHGAAAAIGAESCDLALYEAESRSLIARRPSYASRGQPIPRFRFPIDAAPASAYAVSTARPYVSNDPARDPFYDPSIAKKGVHSLLTVPVQREGKILGLLYARNKPGGFSTEDAEVLEALAGAAAVTLENIRLYSEERDRRVLNESLQEMSRALVGTLSEDMALETVLDQMWRVVHYRTAAAVVRETDRLRVAACRGGLSGMQIALVSAPELRRILEGHQLRVLTEASAVLPELGLPGGPGKALASPLVAKGEVLGALVVALEAGHLPGPRESQLVNAFADHAALFLEAGAVLRREREARARSAAVARITRMTANRRDAESLLADVAPEVLAVSSADRVALYLRTPRTDSLVAVAVAGATPVEQRAVREHRLDLQSPVLASFAGKIETVAFKEDSNPPPESLKPFRDATSLLLVPLAWRDEVLGAVALARMGRPRRFDPGLIEFLRDLAQQLALGLQNARLLSSLSRMASTDELTQLANRRRFTEAFRVEIARTRRSGVPLSLVMADLDHLKRINDTFGHPAGDDAIRHVAEAFKRGRRETDLAARLGGEEFALLLPGTDLAGAIAAAERIRQELAGSALPAVGTVTVSLGVATCPNDGVREEDLIRMADDRLYAAKSAGRNQVCADGPAAARRINDAPVAGN